MTIHTARREGIKELAASPTAALDVDVLLAHCIGREKSYVLAHRNDELCPMHYSAFTNALHLRKTGFPVAYITGHKEFYALDFLVTKDVLIPKPDTELLVELALAEIARRSDIPSSHISFTQWRRNDAQIVRIADVCTGSGCVGISISHALATRGIAHTLMLTDISNAALAVAKKNAARLLPNEQFPRTAFALGDLLHAVPDSAQFDIIVANPPYVPHDEVDALLHDGRSEPRLALDGDADTAMQDACSAVTLPESASGEYMHNAQNAMLPAARKSDGLAIIKRLVPLAYAHLADGGTFFVESGEYNATQTAELLRAAGFAAVTTHCDLAGLPRVTIGCTACNDNRPPVNHGNQFF
ncbi:MAG: peptide chain release factor N(5)-glutamine methyltransferase [Treponema sp.]|nr:peptide chain release factor N(5)-glutamine methyltransferase [Treponema sp.]